MEGVGEEFHPLKEVVELEPGPELRSEANEDSASLMSLLSRLI